MTILKVRWLLNRSAEASRSTPEHSTYPTYPTHLIYLSASDESPQHLVERAIDVPSIARATNALAFATAKLTPCRFFAGGTPGISRGSPDVLRTAHAVDVHDAVVVARTAPVDFDRQGSGHRPRQVSDAVVLTRGHDERAGRSGKVHRQRAAPTRVRVEACPRLRLTMCMPESGRPFDGVDQARR